VTSAIAALPLKPFVWITALVLSLPFLGGAAFMAYDVMGRPDILTNPESKVAIGWLFTGSMFLVLGLRGWGGHRKKRRAEATKSRPV
jgi:hypothetical protein